MINKKILLIGFLLLANVLSLRANNLSVTTLSLVGQDIPTQTTFVQFNMSWDNSWRVSTAPSNYDAVWVFVKYKDVSGLWKHATLTTTNTDHSVTTENGVASEFNSATDGTGVFIQRSGVGTPGSINWDGVKLKWDYGADGLADDANVTVKVFAIEMVYIPGGSFYVGDGTVGATVAGHLHNANSTTTPFQITSEAAITLGGTTDGYLGNNNASGMYTADDFDNIQEQTLPADFPKGHSAFYVMKYEITQIQYVDFLNCLTRIQQNTRTATDISVTSVTNRYVMSGSATMIIRNGIRCGATLPSSGPITFYNDYNENGTRNEADDGQHITSNYVNWIDGTAYADWAGLRPMTELEFEKAARGSLTPVVNEYAWGTINLTTIGSSSLLNLGEESEVSNTTNSNCNAYPTNIGPIRAGIFATSSTTTREGSGASYYGVMEMSGNLIEAIVPIGTSPGRNFQGILGDGSLSTNGNATNSDWPGYNAGEVTGAGGTGFRGGSFGGDDNRLPQYMRISDRRWCGVNGGTGRDSFDSMRLVRTAP